MKATVREWVKKAEGDFISAGREYRARKSPNHDSACFHAQQCAEKLMKAMLIDRHVVPPKTHDLVALHRLIMPIEPKWQWQEAELDWLTRAAVGYRYPGNQATRRHASKAVDLAKRLRVAILALIP